MAMTDTEPATLLDRMADYVPAATYKWVEKKRLTYPAKAASESRNIILTS